MKLNGLDLFSGIGGLTLALHEWVRPIAYCENDRYAQSVLLSRMHDGGLPIAPIWDDVRTLQNAHLPKVDIIAGGFPCQNLSCAGRGEGLGGERSGLYLEIERIVRETNPAFVFLENVPAIRTRGLGRVVWGLSELGYDLRWTVVSAAEVGAPHLRKRWFLLAHASGRGRKEHGMRESSLLERSSSTSADNKRKENHSDESGKALADSGSIQVGDEPRGRGWSGGESAPQPRHNSWWQVEPDVGRVVDELPARLDRLKCLGNSVVPAQAREAFKRLMGLE